MLTLLGIALPSAAVVVALRRWIVFVPWRTAFLFLVMTFIFLHGAVFTSRLPVPVDEVARGYPYKGLFGEITAKNPLTNDTARLFLPWMQVAREELLSFRAPLWNRYSFSGYPLLANGESAPFSPLFLATLFVPLPKQIVAMAGLKIFLALLFGYLFARRAGASEPAAVFAATAFAWSVFQTVFLYFSTTAVTALLPCALFALFHAMDQQNRREVVFVAIVVASLLANGHPESVLHIAIVGGGLMSIDLALTTDRREWLSRFRYPLVGALGGLALSAPAWIPVLEQIFLSTRLHDLKRFAENSAYPVTALWAMLVPNGFGNPVRHNWSWILNYSLVAASYLGLLVTVLVACAAVSRRTTKADRLYVLFAVGLWLMAMRWTFIGAALNALPPFSFTANDKLRFGALYIAAIVAAKYTDQLRQRLTPELFMTAAAAVVGALYVYTVRRSLLRATDLAGAVIVVLFVAGVAAWRKGAPRLAFALTAIELLILNAGFNALVDRKYYRPRLPIIDALRRVAPPHEPFRIVGFDWTFLPNASAQYGVEDIRGSDPMSLDAYTESLKQITIDDRSIDFDRVIDVNHPFIDFLNVRYLLSGPGLNFGERWRLIYTGPDGGLFENQRARQRFYFPGGEGEIPVIRSPAPGRFSLVVRSREPALVASSEVTAPGRRVRVNGQWADVEVIHGSFVGFRVPQGESIVELVYRPSSLYLSMGLMVAAIVGLVIVPLGKNATFAE